MKWCVNIWVNDEKNKWLHHIFVWFTYRECPNAHFATFSFRWIISNHDSGWSTSESPNEFQLFPFRLVTIAIFSIQFSIFTRYSCKLSTQTIQFQSVCDKEKNENVIRWSELTMKTVQYTFDHLIVVYMKISNKEMKQWN